MVNLRNWAQMLGLNRPTPPSRGVGPHEKIFLGVNFAIMHLLLLLLRRRCHGNVNNRDAAAAAAAAAAAPLPW